MQTQPENVQPASQPQDQDSYGYFDAFSDAFRRIWKNRTLWIWGIFLGLGGFSFNFNGGAGGGTEDFSSAEAEQFLSNFWWIIPIAIGVLFLIGIAFWVVSTIVRPGVIRALDRLQNNPDSETKHRDIWEQGKAKFVEIIKLDLMIILISFGLIVLLGFLVASLIGIGFSLKDNVGLIVLLGFLGFVFLVLFIFISIILSLVRSFGTVFIALGDMKWSVVIKMGYQLIKKNKKEAFKLILINILISLVGGMIGMIVIGIIAGILFGISFAIMLAFKPLGIALMVIFGLIILASILFLKSFISLWSQDVIVWWVKKMQGVKVSQEEQLKEGATEEVQSSEAVPQGGLLLGNDN